MDNYIQLALVTKSPDFHGEIVPADMLIDALSDFITAANRLDKIKKAMFYRKLIEGVGGIFQGSNRIHKEWKLNDNSELTETSAIDIIHSILGKATESGELCEQLITTFQTGVFDPVNFKEEIGDSQWYDAIGLAALGETSFDNNQKSNIAKLQDRFKGKFDAYFANNRDLESERTVLETNHISITQRQLEHALNFLSIDNTMNLPDFMLADKIVKIALTFNQDGTINGD